MGGFHQLIAVLLVLFSQVSAQITMTTYVTTLITITSCGSEILNCPFHHGTTSLELHSQISATQVIVTTTSNTTCSDLPGSPTNSIDNSVVVTKVSTIPEVTVTVSSDTIQQKSSTWLTGGVIHTTVSTILWGSETWYITTDITNQPSSIITSVPVPNSVSSVQLPGSVVTTALNSSVSLEGTGPSSAQGTDNSKTVQSSTSMVSNTLGGTTVTPGSAVGPSLSLSLLSSQVEQSSLKSSTGSTIVPTAVPDSSNFSTGSTTVPTLVSAIEPGWSIISTNSVGATVVASVLTNSGGTSLTMVTSTLGLVSNTRPSADESTAKASTGQASLPTSDASPPVTQSKSSGQTFVSTATTPSITLPFGTSTEIGGMPVTQLTTNTVPGSPSKTTFTPSSTTSAGLPTGASSSSGSVPSPVYTIELPGSSTTVVGFLFPTITVIPWPSFSTSQTINPLWTTNTVITTTGSQGQPTTLPVIVGCPGCGRNAIILWGITWPPQFDIWFDFHLTFPKLPTFSWPCIMFCPKGGNPQPPFTGDPPLSPEDSQPDPTASKPTQTQSSSLTTSQSSTTSSAAPTATWYKIIPNQNSTQAQQQDFQAILEKTFGPKGWKIKEVRAINFISSWAAPLNSSQVAEFSLHPAVRTITSKSTLGRIMFNLPRSPHMEEKQPHDDLDSKDQSSSKLLPREESWVLQKTDDDDLKVASQSPGLMIKDLPGYEYNSAAGQGSTVYIVDSGANTENADYIDRAGKIRWLFPSDPTDPRLNWTDQKSDSSLYDGNFPSHGSCVFTRAAGAHLGITKLAEVVIVKMAVVRPDEELKKITNPPDSPVDVENDAIVAVIDDILANQPNEITRKAVINISWGFYFGRGEVAPPDLDDLQDSLRRLAWIGGIIVTSTSNDGFERKDIDTYPNLWADEIEMITVGSTNTEGVRSGFTQWGDMWDVRVDVAAPGEDLKCPEVRGTEYRLSTGTSFAAPQVAGLIAYFMSLPELQNELQTAARAGTLPRYMKEYVKKKAYVRTVSGGNTPVLYNGGNFMACKAQTSGGIVNRQAGAGCALSSMATSAKTTSTSSSQNTIIASTKSVPTSSSQIQTSAVALSTLKSSARSSIVSVSATPSSQTSAITSISSTPISSGYVCKESSSPLDVFDSVYGQAEINHFCAQDLTMGTKGLTDISSMGRQDGYYLFQYTDKSGRNNSITLGLVWTPGPTTWFPGLCNPRSYQHVIEQNCIDYFTNLMNACPKDASAPRIGGTITWNSPIGCIDFVLHGSMSKATSTSARVPSPTPVVPTATPISTGYVCRATGSSSDKFEVVPAITLINIFCVQDLTMSTAGLEDISNIGNTGLSREGGYMKYQYTTASGASAFITIGMVWSAASSTWFSGYCGTHVMLTITKDQCYNYISQVMNNCTASPPTMRTGGTLTWSSPIGCLDFIIHGSTFA